MPDYGGSRLWSKSRLPVRVVVGHNIDRRTRQTEWPNTMKTESRKNRDGEVGITFGACRPWLRITVARKAGFWRWTQKQSEKMLKMYKK